MQPIPNNPQRTNDRNRSGSYQSPYRTQSYGRGEPPPIHHPVSSQRPYRPNLGNRGGRNQGTPYYGPNQNQGRAPYHQDTSYYGSGYNQGRGSPSSFAKSSKSCRI